MHEKWTSRLLGVVAAIAVVGATLSLFGPRSRAQTPLYMAAPDGPGSVWRLNVQTGELEHCSLVKGGCDVVDRND